MRLEKAGKHDLLADLIHGGSQSLAEHQRGTEKSLSRWKRRGRSRRAANIRFVLLMEDLNHCCCLLPAGKYPTQRRQRAELTPNMSSRVIHSTCFISFPFIIMSSFLQNIISGPQKKRSRWGFYFSFIMCFENKVKSRRYKSQHDACVSTCLLDLQTIRIRQLEVTLYLLIQHRPLLNCRQMQPSRAFCVVHTHTQQPR